MRLSTIHIRKCIPKTQFCKYRPIQKRTFHSSIIKYIDYDPYNTLGINKSADAKQIKKAYYDLVKKFHPDVNKEKDAEKKFHKIQQSYEILRDKDKKAQFDQFGPNAFDENGNPNPFGGAGAGAGPGGASSGNPFAGFGGGGFSTSGGGNPFAGMGFDFEDLFKEAFTGGRGSSRSQGRAHFVTEHVGDNVEVLKSIPFKDSIFGSKVTINYKVVDSCGTCKGSGLKTGAKKQTCPTCHGTGQTTHIMGGFHMASTCPTCQGTGVTISKADECNTCHGNGVQEIPKSTTIDIPPGITDGSRIRVPGAGDAPFVTKDDYNQLRNGDLIVRISVQKDPVFKRDNNDLVVNQDILMTTASLGGEIIVPTLDGQKIKLKIRPGVQNGRKLIIPEKGVPINRNLNNRGNLDVILNVKTLIAETPTQTALLEALADAFNDKNAKRNDVDWQLDVEDALKYDAMDEKDLHPSKLARIGKVLGKFFNFDSDKKDDSNKNNNNESK
ncbi:MDJ1 [Candida jiufengensis]|uniref:MDJ1 n=1 Tax=Candida jiufengensis TaxID=497108 RepID=UPI002224674D|nr:MDJ1 [Candida jiufengensis]KAI5956615.1 MDJ1 [Candida jiufengensis]